MCDSSGDHKLAPESEGEEKIVEVAAPEESHTFQNEESTVGNRGGTSLRWDKNVRGRGLGHVRERRRA